MKTMDFVYYLAAVLLAALLMFLLLALKIRRSKKRLTVKNIGVALGEVKDDLNEPARWVP